MSEAATGLIVLSLVSAAFAFIANRRTRLFAWGGVLGGRRRLKGATGPDDR